MLVPRTFIFDLPRYLIMLINLALAASGMKTLFLLCSFRDCDFFTNLPRQKENHRLDRKKIVSKRKKKEACDRQSIDAIRQPAPRSRNFAVGEKRRSPVGNRGVGQFFLPSRRDEKFPANPQIPVGNFLRGPAERKSVRNPRILRPLLPRLETNSRLSSSEEKKEKKKQRQREGQVCYVFMSDQSRN